MILQSSYLRPLWFYNCHTCAKYNFTMAKLEPVVILQFSDLCQLLFHSFQTCANYKLRLSYFHQLWSCKCQFCANYDFTNSQHLYFLNCHTCAKYGFTIVILALNKFLHLSYLRQLWFCNFHTGANFDFTIVIPAPVIFLQLS